MLRGLYEIHIAYLQARPVFLLDLSRPITQIHTENPFNCKIDGGLQFFSYFCSLSRNSKTCFQCNKSIFSIKHDRNSINNFLIKILKISKMPKYQKIPKILKISKTSKISKISKVPKIPKN